MPTFIPSRLYAPVTVSAITLTLDATYHGRLIVLTANTGVAVTIPDTGLPVNFFCKVVAITANGWFRVGAAAGLTFSSSQANSFAVKTINATADIYRTGSSSYIIESGFLTYSYLLSGVPITPYMAWSPSRKITENYSGNISEVRRSSDSTAQNIGMLANETLNTTTLNAFVGSGSGFYRTVYDQSGNARNLVQTTAANQPRIINGGAMDTINGRPVIRGLSAGTFLDAAVNITSSTLTVGFVTSMANGTASYGRLASLGVAGANDYDNGSYSGLLRREMLGTGLRTDRNNTFYGSATVTYDTAFRYFIRFDGTNITLFMNGTKLLTTAASGAFNASVFRLFNSTQGGTAWDGPLGEGFLYNAALTDAQIGILDADWKTYFTIA